jgi:hypothetical protein
MNASHKRLRGLTEEDWLNRLDPLNVPKVLPRPSPRKSVLLACAFVLDSPGGFSTPFARRVAETVQRTAFGSPFPCDLVATLRATVAREFPRDLTPGHGGFQFAPSRSDELGHERYSLSWFLDGLTGSKSPNRGTVNSVARTCLHRVGAETRAAAREKLEALRRELTWRYPDPAEQPSSPPARSGWRGVLDRLFPTSQPPNLEPPANSTLLPGFRDVVLALFPESERAALARERWVWGQIPVAVRDRFERLAADATTAEARAALTEFVREIYGNPFRPPEIDPAWRVWNHGAVWRIAEQIVASGNFADVPILADALEDAGCTDEHLLGHCREERTHVPGCWALDAALGWDARIRDRRRCAAAEPADKVDGPSDDE